VVYGRAVNVSDPPVVELAGTLLVDRRGWVLLQERDENAPVAANQWGIVGGHAEPHEDLETTVYRELAEETGLDWHDGLTLWRDELVVDPRTGQAQRFSIWTAPVDLTDDDIVLGEGRQIVFVDPALVLALDLGGPSRPILADFLASDRYLDLVAAPARVGPRTTQRELSEAPGEG